MEQRGGIEKKQREIGNPARFLSKGVQKYQIIYSAEGRFSKARICPFPIFKFTKYLKCIQIPKIM